MNSKFRVWDKAKNKFLPFEKRNELALNIILLPTGQIFWFNPSDKDNLYEDVTDKFDVLFYTGVNDKNDKEIYDRDILKCEAQNYIGNVWFSNGSFMTNCEGFGDHPISGTNPADFEIIGNTLQNAELLRS